MQDIEAPPFPYETMAALRSMGYKFSNALADVVDNSIDSGATNIDLYVMPDSSKTDSSYVLIMDDGKGMTNEELVKAMTIGSSNSKSTDLGKFGMGMKTASLSQCDKLIVCSKSSKGQISAYCWDMDYLKSTNKWLLIQKKLTDLPDVAKNHIDNIKSGTVVMWSSLRAYRGKDAESAGKSIDLETLEARQYLSLVFHKFLSGQVPGKKIKFILNKRTQITAWDPYCTNETNRELLDPVILEVRNKENIFGKITLTPILLPSQDKFSSSAAFHHAAGIHKWVDMQGFYFYRNFRLIDFGGWNHMRAKDEKSKFLRIDINYTENSEMDEELAVNVAKQTASIPKSIRPQIDKLLRDWIGYARSKYSQASDKPDTFREKKYSLAEVEKMLIRECEPNEKNIVRKLFLKISNKL